MERSFVKSLYVRKGVGDHPHGYVKEFAGTAFCIHSNEAKSILVTALHVAQAAQFQLMLRNEKPLRVLGYRPAPTEDGKTIDVLFLEADQAIPTIEIRHSRPNAASTLVAVGYRQDDGNPVQASPVYTFKATEYDEACEHERFMLGPKAPGPTDRITGGFSGGPLLMTFVGDDGLTSEAAIGVVTRCLPNGDGIAIPTDQIGLLRPFYRTDRRRSPTAGLPRVDVFDPTQAPRRRASAYKSVAALVFGITNIGTLTKKPGAPTTLQELEPLDEAAVRASVDRVTQWLEDGGAVVLNKDPDTRLDPDRATIQVGLNALQENREDSDESCSHAAIIYLAGHTWQPSSDPSGAPKPHYLVPCATGLTPFHADVDLLPLDGPAGICTSVFPAIKARHKLLILDTGGGSLASSLQNFDGALQFGTVQSMDLPGPVDVARHLDSPVLQILVPRGGRVWGRGDTGVTTLVKSMFDRLKTAAADSANGPIPVSRVSHGTCDVLQSQEGLESGAEFLLWPTKAIRDELDARAVNCPPNSLNRGDMLDHYKLDQERQFAFSVWSVGSSAHEALCVLPAPSLRTLRLLKDRIMRLQASSEHENPNLVQIKTPLKRIGTEGQPRYAYYSINRRPTTSFREALGLTAQPLRRDRALHLLGALGNLAARLADAGLSCPISEDLRILVAPGPGLFDLLLGDVEWLMACDSLAKSAGAVHADARAFGRLVQLTCTPVPFSTAHQPLIPPWRQIVQELAASRNTLEDLLLGARRVRDALPRSIPDHLVEGPALGEYINRIDGSALLWHPATRLFVGRYPVSRLQYERLKGNPTIHVDSVDRDLLPYAGDGVSYDGLRSRLMTEVSFTDAQDHCARSRSRLLKASEWLQLLGHTDEGPGSEAEVRRRATTGLVAMDGVVGQWVDDQCTTCNDPLHRRILGSSDGCEDGRVACLGLGNIRSYLGFRVCVAEGAS